MHAIAGALTQSSLPRPQVRNNDDARLSSLLCAAAAVGHPEGTFACGNMKSLRADPASAGVDVGSELRKVPFALRLAVACCF